MTGGAKNTKNFKNFDGRIETLPLMRHNLGFGLTPEIWERTVLGGSQDHSEGSWGDWIRPFSYFLEQGGF